MIGANERLHILQMPLLEFSWALWYITSSPACLLARLQTTVSLKKVIFEGTEEVEQNMTVMFIRHT